MTANYLNQVRIPTGKRGSYAIEHFTHPAGEKLDTSNLRTSIIGGQKNEPVVYDNPTTWHRLKYHGGVWMTDLPIEQQQHRNALRDMAGDVLVGGLGIGLAANWLASRPEAKSVTVVEISKEVIALVGPYLIDQGKKIKVVNANLLKWLKNRSAKTVFDWAFYDIWQSDNESTFFKTVVPLRQLSVPFLDDSRVICWNEDVMRGQLALGLQSRFMCATQGVNGTTVKMLAHPDRHDVWIDWSVPFFLAVEEKLVTEKNLQRVVSIYAGTYGRPHFKAAWNNLLALL